MMIRTSKLVMWVFIVLFVYVVYKGVTYDFSSISYIDTAIFCTCITSVGGILGAIILKYYNNSNAENIPKIQISLYKEAMNIRYEYNSKMMKLQKELKIEDVQEVDDDNLMNEVSENIISSAISDLDEKLQDSQKDVEIQSF